MLLLRGVFWLGLVAFLVPYSTVDLANATFTIDHKALLTRLEAAPRYCADHTEVCAKARALAQQMGDDGLAAAKSLAAKLQTHG